MKLINKSGTMLTLKSANSLKASILQHVIEKREIQKEYGEELSVDGDVRVDYNFTNNGNTYQRSIFYWHMTKAGNIVFR